MHLILGLNNTNWVYGVLALAYILGSIPFGLLITRAFGLGDIRKVGSGNIGATNVMRTGHKSLAILTLLCDGGKGFAAVWLARYIYTSDFGAMAGLAAVIGHIFPVWLRFKGGKGVATTIGVLFGLNWMLGAAVCAMWLAIFFMVRISSVAALLSIGYSGIIAYMLSNDLTALLCLALAALIVFTHHDNIARLMQGTEHVFKKGVA